VRSGLRRREFLAAVAAPILCGACGSRPYDSSAFTVPSSASVGLFPASHYETDFADLILRGFRELDVNLKGLRVLLKPNMVEYERGTAINTHPHVITGAVAACRMAGASTVIVGEGPGHRRDMEYLLSSTGLGEQLRDDRVRFVDLNVDDVRIVPLKSWYTGAREIALPVELLQADFVISMPKLKVHHFAGVTCSMKNLFGTVPGAVYGWPKNTLHIYGVSRSILDLTSTIRPQFAIVDAVTAMEGDGPIMGRPRDLGFIAMGSDLVAVDATCARVIGIDPMKVPYLKAAGQFLGVLDESRTTQLGESPSRYTTRFDVIPSLEHMRLPAS
jgi:uncharacterized protein (DUF362 family)